MSLLARRAVAISLGTVAVLALVTATFGWWARAAVYDEDRFVAAVDDALDRPEVTAALATFLVDELLVVVDLEGAVANLVPAAVAASAVAGVRAAVTDAVDRAITSPAGRAALTGATRVAHRGAVAVLRGDTPPGVVVRDGAVWLDLSPLMVRAVDRVAASGLLPRLDPAVLGPGADRQARLAALRTVTGVDLPADVGLIAVYRGDTVARAATTVGWARDAMVRAERLVVGITLLAAAAAAGSVVVAVHRRRAIAVLGLGALVGSLAARLLVGRVTDQLPLVVTDDGARLAVAVVAERLVSGLVTAVSVLALVAAVAVIGSVAVGPLPGRVRSAVVPTVTRFRNGP